MAHMHNLGMVWGDCKPDNVLLFPDESRVGGLKAKLSDFGACEPQSSATTTFHSISHPWTAPKVDPRGPWGEAVKGFDGLIRAEVYAYGLVLWAIVMDGCNDRPFWNQPVQSPGSRTPRMTTEEIQRVKWDAASPNRLLNPVVEAVRQHLSGGTSGKTPIASGADTKIVSSLLKQCL